MITTLTFAASHRFRASYTSLAGGKIVLEEYSRCKKVRSLVKYGFCISSPSKFAQLPGSWERGFVLYFFFNAAALLAAIFAFSSGDKVLFFPRVVITKGEEEGDAILGEALALESSFEVLTLPCAALKNDVIETCRFGIFEFIERLQFSQYKSGLTVQ